ncbi:hypothetical protein [Acinetobacter sp. MD2]|uniref:hypothetical protein n=1 Tax=Acinetobacter sp. MD2 TaxID=2600066 RepID=UPI002D1E8475|nr:hypothetical protein [Acinetobacter sp. MD2]MEB3766564.1 hypothetical protein [Acinetobacter sp. MD2]
MANTQFDIKQCVGLKGESHSKSSYKFIFIFHLSFFGGNMNKGVFFFGLYCLSLTAHAGLVEDIFNKKVSAVSKNPKMIYKYDVYQCGVSQNGIIAFSDWRKCLERNNPDKISKLNNIDRTNDLYQVLVENYKLKKDLKCRIYAIKDNYSDQDYRKFEQNHGFYERYDMPEYQQLGGKNTLLRSNPSALDQDLYNDVRAVAFLSRPDMDEPQRNAIMQRFKKRHQFIQKSCGTEFIGAFNRYLNDYADFSKEQYIKEAVQKVRNNGVSGSIKTQNLVINARNKTVNKNDSIETLIHSKTLQEQIRQESVGLCKATTDYQIYITSNKIVSSYKSIERANSALKNDQDRKRITGLTNVDVHDMANAMIQRSKQDIRENFTKYKDFGGLATSAAAVKEIHNPCKTI